MLFTRSDLEQLLSKETKILASFALFIEGCTLEHRVLKHGDKGAPCLLECVSGSSLLWACNGDRWLWMPGAHQSVRVPGDGWVEKVPQHDRRVDTKEATQGRVLIECETTLHSVNDRVPSTVCLTV